MPSPFPLTFDFHTEGKVYTFATVNELSDWWRKERDFLAKFTSFPVERPKSLHGFGREIATIVGQCEEKIHAVVAAKSKGEGEALRSAVEQATSWFAAHHGRGRLPLAESPRGRKLEEIASSSGVSAAQWALIVWSGIGRNSMFGDPASHLGGGLDAVLFDRGIANVEATRESLQDLVSELSQQLAQAKADSESAVDDLRRLRNGCEEIREEIARQRDENSQQTADLSEKFDLALREARLEFEGEVHKSRTTLQEYRAFFEREIQLHSSVTYWGVMQRKHVRLSLVFGALALAGGGGLAYYLDFVVKSFTATGADPKTPVVIFTGLAVGLIAWGLRLLVRLFLNSVHLRADAEERVTMLQTYLAIAKNGEGITDDDRKLMIQTVFRSALTPAKDDGGMTGLDIIKQALGTKDK